MNQLNVIDIETRWGFKSFELYEGDITRMGTRVDLLAVSILADNPYPLPNTVVGALHTNLKLDLAELRKDSEFDLRRSFGCWVSKELPIDEIKRILCVELFGGYISNAEVIQNVFVMLSILES